VIGELDGFALAARLPYYLFEDDAGTAIKRIKRRVTISDKCSIKV